MTILDVLIATYHRAETIIAASAMAIAAAGIVCAALADWFGWGL